MSSRAKADKSQKRSAPAGWESEPEQSADLDSLDPASYSTSIQIARYSVNTLGWVCVVFLASFLAVQCDRYIALRRYEAPPRPQDEMELSRERLSDTYGVNAMDAKSEELGAVAPAPIIIDENSVLPTDGFCMRKEFGGPDFSDWAGTEPSAFAFDGERYRMVSAGRLAFARDAQLYVVDTGYDSALHTQLHVVPGLVQHATIHVAAFHDEPGALDAFDACTYRADITLDTANRSSKSGSGPLKVDVFRLQRRDWNATQNQRASFNITFAIPYSRGNEVYSLKLGRYNVTLYDGLALDELSIETHGRVHAQSRALSKGLSVDTYGVRGNVTGHFNIVDGDGAIRTDGASIDARFIVVRGPNQAGQTRKLDLQANNAALNAQIMLGNEAHDCHLSTNPAKNCAWVRPFAFDITATSSNYPQRVTLLEGSYYPSGVHIATLATNAPATLKLDAFFEGTYVARSGKSALGAGKQGGFGGVADPSRKGRERVFVEGLETRHVSSGAVGWGSEDSAREGTSYAEVETDEGMHMAHVVISPSSSRRVD
ncbi:hypothetical protein PENSPDRAFT_54358 [Peniophora sp. CONT]|nr:hypothetical protein PENSPDRAFT_54358 [Peniophora sp. CONT]